MKKPVFPLVGRAGFEPATNGLKARYALIAQSAFPLCKGCMGGMDERFSPAFCQKSPTYRATNESIAQGL